MYYVGITGDVTKRFNQHLTGRGSVWTKRFPPKRMQHAESFSGKTQEEMETIENDFTLVVMSKRGIEHTRGGKWAKIGLTPADVAEIRSLIKPIPGICYVCGRPDHGGCEFTNLAFRTMGVPVSIPVDTFAANRTAIKLPSKAVVKREFHCSRCGHPGHKSNRCYAKTDKDGNPLG